MVYYSAFVVEPKFKKAWAVAWSIADYNDFLEVVQDAFGADRGEAADLYTELSEVLGYGSLTVADLEEYADVVSDLAAPIIEEYEEELYEERVVAPEEVAREPGEEPEEELGWDYEFDWQDEWFEEGEEIEITADLHYED